VRQGVKALGKELTPATEGAVKPALKQGAGAVRAQAGREVVRFRASDGSIHEGNADQIDKAREIDPGLKVLGVHTVQK